MSKCIYCGMNGDVHSFNCDRNLHHLIDQLEDKNAELLSERDRLADQIENMQGIIYDLRAQIEEESKI